MEKTDPLTPEAKNIAVVSGGLSDSSSSTRLSQHLVEAVSNVFADVGVVGNFDMIELRPLATDIINATTSPAHSQALDTALHSVKNADGIITVSPTFKASYSGLFKAFWDIVEDGDIADTPTLLGATGGTARHSLVIDMAMRPLFAYMNALVAPRGVFAATDDWGEVTDSKDSTKDDPLFSRIEKAGAEFAYLLIGNKRRKSKHGVPGTFPVKGVIPRKKSKRLEVTPFDQLLKGIG